MLQYEVADCLTRIKNAYAVRKAKVSVRKTKLNLKILEVMARQGSIAGFEEKGDDLYHVEVALSYSHGYPSMKSVSVHSSPGHKRYYKVNDIPRFKAGLSYGIITTSKGVMTTHEAKELGLGGELLCVVE